MSSNLNNLGDKKIFGKILSLILIEIKEKISLYNKEKTSHNYFLIKNYIIFFMIITINLKNFSSFVLTIFEGKKNFFKSLIESINTLNKTKRRDELFSILNFLFLEEYRDLYFNEEEKDKEKKKILENIFIEKQLLLPLMNLGISSNDDNIYIKMIDILLKFDLSYDNFFTYYQNIKIEERSEYKLQIVQSIIRVAFSKEKYNYTKEKNFEYNFIKKIIEKDVKETFEKYQNDYKTLLRKEDLCDDVIKNIFFIFGNSMLIQSYIKPIKKLLKKVEYNNEFKNNSEYNDIKTMVTIEEFNTFFDEMIAGLNDSMPHVIIILLKIFYACMRKFFSMKDNDYNALYTALFFNFMLNPRIQNLYGISPHINQHVNSLNKLVWKAIYNNKYGENEKEAIFNESIMINNKKVTNFIEQNIISIDENKEEIKTSLNNLFTEKYLIYPKFLFYLDSNLLCGTIQGGKEKIIDFKEIKISEK